MRLVKDRELDNALTYISTRGANLTRTGFGQVFMRGMAPDGGLFVPERWPAMPALDIAQPYATTAALILQLFAGTALDQEICAKITESAYADFTHPEVTPLRQLDDRLYLLELFHGPTLAFKDIALQVLARLFDHMMAQTGGLLTLIGATSGDTGSAAIEACKNCRNVEIFILYPQGRPSEIQRRQMTTVHAANVHALAVDADFDACQTLVKALFADTALAERKRLSAVNSINWARIVMQSVYYARAALRLPGAEFVVPSGNFGNLYAGYVARQLGFPVGSLIAATNSNDTLHRFFSTGRLSASPTVPTLSPSMDIQIPSNLERYLFDVLGRDPERLSAAMRDASGAGWSLPSDALVATRHIFASGSADNAQTVAAIADSYKRYGVLLDPHTAVGAAVAATLPPTAMPRVILATAHAAKFPDAVRAATGKSPETPPAVEALFAKPECIQKIAADKDRIRDYILSSQR